MTPDRIAAFESCLLNTVVRIVRPAFSGLTLTNCLESEEFQAAALLALDSALFKSRIEPAMETARVNLLYRLTH